MLCPTCQAVVPAGYRFCSACGASANGRGASSAPPSAPQTESLLAEANLLRMRAQWNDAETRCIDVMRLDPNNVHAHSLLGDIYRDQGKYEEASQWYQMALDLDPTSAADKAKLAIMEHEKARMAARGPSFLTIAPQIAGPSGLPGPVGTQKLMGVSPVLWLRGLMVLSAVFIVAVAILIVSIRNGRRSDIDVPTGTIPGTAQKLPTMPAGPPLPSSGSVGVARPNTPTFASPMYRPSTGPRTNESTNTPNLTSSGGYSHQELAIESFLQRRAGLGPGVQIASVTLDPRESRALLVLVRGQNGPIRSPEEMRDGIVYDAFRAVQAAFTADPTIQKVSVSVRVMTGGHAEPAFAGDLDRSMAMGSAAPVSAQQALAAFSGIWWAPAYIPQPSGAPESYPGQTPQENGPESP